MQTVASFTGQPEMQGGLVKTLDFKIYLGLLSETYNPHHQEDMKRIHGVSIDMVVVNLYPFAQTVAQQDVTLEDARTYIDIGGPCMLRASAKNFLRVASMCNPDDYSSILKEMREHAGSVSLKTRYTLAVQSFNHTAKYDKAIAEYLNSSNFEECEKIYTYCDG